MSEQGKDAERLGAGTEVDSLIAVRVFGRLHVTGAAVPEGERHRGEPLESQEAWIAPDGDRYWCRACGSLPAFSTEIEAAWAVVEQMRQRGWMLLLKALPPNRAFMRQGSGSELCPEPDAQEHGTEGKVLAEFYWIPIATDADVRLRFAPTYALATSAPVAICRAALAAADAEIEARSTPISQEPKSEASEPAPEAAHTDQGAR